MVEVKGVSCLLSLAMASGAALALLVARWVFGVPITWLYMAAAGLAFVVVFVLTEAVQLRFFAYPADSWMMSVGFNVAIDFCVWVLEVDGLHVPPFEHHPQHVGPLQALGLTASAWQAWLERVVALQVESDQQRRALRDPAAWVKFMRSHPVNVPARAWSGDLPIGDRLVEHWDRYLEVLQQRSEREQALLIPDRPESHPTLWEALEPYHTDLETLKVYLVGYPVAVEHTVPPVSLLIGINAQELDQAALRAKILHGAARLAAQAPQAQQGDSWPAK